MKLKCSFLLAMSFIIISSSLVFDHSRAEEHEASLNNAWELTTPQRRTSKPGISSSQDLQDVDGMRSGVKHAQPLSQRACICGLSSFKCCYNKSMLREIKRARRSVAEASKAGVGDESINKWLKPEDLH